MDNINIGINEKIVTGRKFRRLIDKDSKLWQLISWWTKANDVEFDDGKTAEQKVGNINGITSDLDDRDDIAASIASVNGVNEELQYRIGGFRIIRGDDGYIYIIDESEGADAVPKKLGDVDPVLFSINNNNEYLFTEDTSYTYVYTSLDANYKTARVLYIKLPNKEYIGLKPDDAENNHKWPSENLWIDEESGLSLQKIHRSYKSTNSSGGMSYATLFLLKNIPAGTMIKSGTMFVFK